MDSLAFAALALLLGSVGYSPRSLEACAKLESVSEDISEVTVHFTGYIVA